MPINTLYSNLFQMLRTLYPKQRITRIRNFVWLMIGIQMSQSVSLSRIAGKIPGEAKLLSYIRRLSRLLNNQAIDVRAWYEPIARRWLEKQARFIQQILLIVDCTKIGFGHQMLIVSIAYRKRSVPIAWTWVKQVRGHSSTKIQLELLSYVYTLIPKGVAVLLVGDSEFGAIDVLKQLEKWRWDYVLRQKARTLVCLSNQVEWRKFGDYIQKAGQSIWLGKSLLTESEIFPISLLVHWKIGEDEPWCLATNLPDRRMTLRAYSRRMWIEEMFADLKKNGFDLERTMLRHADRLSRLTLAVAILYVWTLSIGTKVTKSGLRHLIDRKDRRDLSIFQIGLRFINRQLINSLPGKILLCYYQ
jgi:hypothetical protein